MFIVFALSPLLCVNATGVKGAFSTCRVEPFPHVLPEEIKVGDDNVVVSVLVLPKGLGVGDVVGVAGEDGALL